LAKPKVEVTSDAVKEPVAVRYAWMDNPGNVPLLYNREGLPASPFRTDEF
jgi:sialate O-acetylesterase